MLPRRGRVGMRFRRLVRDYERTEVPLVGYHLACASLLLQRAPYSLAGAMVGHGLGQACLNCHT